jgi:hypothetical protein
LRASFTSTESTQVGSNARSLLSGEYLPQVDVKILDSYNQPFLDASFFSVLIKVMNQSGGSQGLEILGRRNQFGVLGAAAFPSNEIQVKGLPGNYSFLISSDDLFADYPSSLLFSNLTLVVKPCPPGRFVDSTRVCRNCPSGEYSSSSESTACTPVPPGSFTLDGVQMILCSTAEGNPVDLQGTTLTSQEQALSVRRQQCNKSAFPTLAVALGVAIPVFVLAVVGYLGVRFYRRQLLEAQAKARHWLIPSKEIEFIRKIGQGSFGEVHLCKHRETLVCVKRILILSQSDAHRQQKDAENGGVVLPFTVTTTKRSKLGNSSHSRHTNASRRTREKKGELTEEDHAIMLLEEEIEIHLQLRHPNIVLCMGAVLEENDVGLITEFMLLGG